MRTERRNTLMKSCSLLHFIAGLVLTASIPTKALAQEWPTRVIRMIVPFAAGGATDLMGRILATGMSRTLGQQVIVENKTGAAGALAVEYVARSDPDGYTICLCTGGAMVIQPAIDKKLAWDPMRDFIAVSHVANFDNIFVAKSDLPVSTLREFIALAKSKPGGLTSGTPGINGTHHLGAINLYQLAGIDLLTVPYKGDAPTLTDLMGGQIDVVSCCRFSGRDVKSYATCAQFADATLGFLREKVPRNWADLCDSVTDNFRIINPKDFRVVT